MKKMVLHIAAHLGGGAGKAISGLAIGLNDYFENKVLLLEQPEQDRYVNLCKENDINVNITSNADKIKQHIRAADYVIFSWWGHPLSLEVYKALYDVDAIVFLWSHVNGLYYPYTSPDFVELFDGAFFTSRCTYENEAWTEEQCSRIELSSEVIYGMGMFKPRDVLPKKSYKVSKDIVVGYSGTINYAKMNNSFPKVCSEIKKSIPTARFKLYGLYDESVYKSFIEFDKGLKEAIIFEGFVEDIESKLAGLDVYCYPLNKENFATTENALLEAMAVGLPIVVLNNPAERTIITHGVDGFVAESIDEMVEYVINICQNEELAQLLGENARRKAIDQYDYKINASKCAMYIKLHSKVEKTKHSFLSLVGETAGENYLYFVNMSKEEYIKNIKNGELLPILRGETKSSLKHYLNYYSDEILEELKNVQGE